MSVTSAKALVVLSSLLVVTACGRVGSESSVMGRAAQLGTDSLGQRIDEAYEEIRTRHARFMARYQRVDPEKPKTSDLTVVNYNVGLLNVLGGFGPSVPYYDERSVAIEENLDELRRRGGGKYDPDVLFLQELWYEEDRDRVAAWAARPENDYVMALTGDKEDADDHGLNLLVKRDVLARNTGLRNVDFVQMGSSEHLYTTKRGYLIADIVLRSRLKVTVATTHLTFGFGDEENASRARKLREISRVLGRKSRTRPHLLLGGDFNLSPHFENPANPEETAGWAQNRAGYVRFVEDTKRYDLLDTYIVTNDDRGYTQDRRRNPLTAISDSTKPEPEQRLDYVWAGTAHDESGVVVKDSNLVFTWNALTENGRRYKFPFSDHFGVASRLLLFTTGD